MNIKRCEIGHFYDADRFDSCPHCAQSAEEADEQLSVETNMEGDSIRNSIQRITGVEDEFDGSDDEGVTIRFENDRFETDQRTEPVVGWLVCTGGVYYGQSFNLRTGRNFIGSGYDMDIILAKDSTVSRDKRAIAFVLYEPRRREFLVQAGEDSRSLVYLNDEVVLVSEKLQKGDVLTLGNTKLMFIPCCGPDFGWDDLQ